MNPLIRSFNIFSKSLLSEIIGAKLRFAVATGVWLGVLIGRSKMANTGVEKVAFTGQNFQKWRRQARTCVLGSNCNAILYVTIIF